ncbi:hypothetical protein [Arthrobacter sp. FW306-04-A]|uniref:hypothetical protein n=1 Tax=Arthrobacter sp. FW306-04-A TaxID=2879619 RepID=UPI0037BF9A70|nr:hypothetical protein LFT43_03220 [Arthrobacter sp. FW306-04-A]
MTTSNALLASLAIIKANWDYSHESYVDNFLPFFLDAVREAQGAPVSPLVAKSHIRERFGIDIPEGVLSTLSRRAAHKNFGRRENGTFIADMDRLSEVRDLGRQKADYLRKQAALVNELVRYSEDRFQRTLSVEEAEDALLNHVEEHSVPLFGSVMNGAPYDARTTSSSDRNTEYVVNAFIGHVVSSMPESFDHLETVVKGSMLAVSLYLPNNSELGRRFDRTTLFLDTPVLLKALGYEGEEARAAAMDLLALSRDVGADIACFEHSVNEVKGILDRSAGKASQGGFNGAHRRAADVYFANLGASASDILLMSQRLEDDIAALDVAIRDRPTASAELTIDELSLEELMETTMGYSSRDTLLNDLDSLTAVHRLRGGRSSSRLESCRALLVTTNGGLARVARTFFVQNGDHEWPPALTDHHLATLVWLKKPHAAPSLPRRQILADCFAALEPGGHIWDRYLEEINHLSSRGEISENDLMLLRYSTEAHRSLMDRTLGDADQVTSEAVSNILETVKARIISPAVAERDAAFQAATNVRGELEAVEQTLQGKESDLAAEQAAARAAKEHVAKLERRLATLEAADENRRSAARARARRQAAVAYRCVLVVCGAVLVLSIVATALPDGIIPGWFKPAVPYCITLAGMAGAATLMWGGSIKGTVGSLRLWLEQRLEEKYLSELGAVSTFPDQTHLRTSASKNR